MFNSIDLRLMVCLYLTSSLSISQNARLVLQSLCQDKNIRLFSVQKFIFREYLFFSFIMKSLWSARNSLLIVSLYLVVSSFDIQSKMIPEHIWLSSLSSESLVNIQLVWPSILSILNLYMTIKYLMVSLFLGKSHKHSFKFGILSLSLHLTQKRIAAYLLT